MSEIIKKKWQDPIYREKMLSILQKRNQSREQRQASSNGNKRSWQRDRGKRLEVMNSQDYHNKMSLAVRQAYENPEIKQKQLLQTRKLHSNIQYIDKLSSISKQLWTDNVYKDKTLNGIAQAIDKISILSKSQWRNPKYREHMIKIIRDRWRDDNWRQKWYGIIRSEECKRKRAEGRAASKVGLGILSYPQKLVCDILHDLGLEYIIEYPIGFYCFDIFIKKYNLLIEVNGDYWHNLPGVSAKDCAKMTYIIEYFPELKLRTIWEHETMCPDRIQQLIKKWCGLSNDDYIDFEFSNVIIKRIENKQADLFLSKYHYLRGIGRNGKCYGAFLNNELIAVCCFASVTRKETADNLGYNSVKIRELNRFCISSMRHKKDFASWFLCRCRKMIISDIDGLKILVAFADSTFGHDGNIYKSDNWLLDKIVPSSYWYVSNDGFVMHKKTLWDHANSLKMIESEFAALHGYTRVNGKEKYRFVYYVKG